MRKTITVIFVISVMAIIPASAGAVTIHQHITAPDDRVILTKIVTVAPPDSDNDGVANADDRCPSTPGEKSYNGCPPPAPTPAPTTTSTTSSTTSTVSTVASSGACPVSLAGESTSPTAVNPSGASGCIQAMPSTWAAYGDPAYASAADAPVSVQLAAMARICAAQGNDAWDAADPC